MAVGDRDLEKIGEYVESKLPQWLIGIMVTLFMALNTAIQLL